VTLSRMASTRMACVQGMETETKFLKALEKVRSWKISGQELQLFDDRRASCATGSNSPGGGGVKRRDPQPGTVRVP